MYCFGSRLAGRVGCDYLCGQAPLAHGIFSAAINGVPVSYAGDHRDVAGPRSPSARVVRDMSSSRLDSKGRLGTGFSAKDDSSLFLALASAAIVRTHACIPDTRIHIHGR